MVVKRNATDAETQDRLAGVPGTFQRIQEGLAHLFQAGYPEADRVLGVQTVICRQNLKQIPALWRWARDRKIRALFRVRDACRGALRRTRNWACPSEEIREVFQQLCRIDSMEYGVEWVPHPPLAGWACARHCYSILIKSNGAIYPVRRSRDQPGNIRTDSAGRRSSARTRSSTTCGTCTRRSKAPCRTCSHNGECYGCRGNAFQVTGDYLASEPRCWVKSK